MKFPISMLRDFVQTDLNAEQVGDLLTMAGFELEGIEEVDGDSVLDIKVVSNRGDGLSVFGLAREVLAKDGSAKATELYEEARLDFVAAPELQRVPSLTIPENAATIESEECNRFACRAYENVNAAGQSPEWMQKRLNQAGMRPISILVDLTNYVMLELGQPLHAFDRDKLVEERIVVRHARPGEKLTTLNGLEHELSGQMMICDGAKPVGVPGVMGGLETEVTDGTTRLLLESANFRNTTVRKTRKQLALNTEASYRFERSVDPNGVVRAIERFTELLLKSQPNVTISNVVDHYPNRIVREPLNLRVKRASMLLGMEIAPEQAQSYLQRLGLDVTPTDEGILSVVPPSWRPDIVREEDLVEELGRVHGYEKIPEELPIGHTPVGGAHGEYLDNDRLREAFVRAGYIQIWSHSLRDKHPLDAEGERIGPKNPASPEMAFLRNSHWPCLADAALRNGARDLHLFEMGKVFGQRDGKYYEELEVALLSVGALIPANRQGEKVPEADFFSVKQALIDIAASIGNNLHFYPGPEDPRLHPTRKASIQDNDHHLGMIGQIHPDLAEETGLPSSTILAFLDPYMLFEGASTISLKSISRNPAVRRDISFEIAKSVPYGEVEKAIAQAGGDVLEKQWLFDVYEGKGIGEANHSLSIGLQLRKQGENFTDEEANQVRERVVAALAGVGAKAR